LPDYKRTILPKTRQTKTNIMKHVCILLFAVIVNSISWSQIPDFSLAGFAALNDGTTGGEGGTEVIVNTYADLKTYAEEENTPYIIKISGSITGIGSVAGQDYEGSIAVESNKSIIGIDNTAFLDGVGLTMSGGSNIFIQNIKMSFISIAEAIPEGSHDIPGIYSEFGDEGRAQILVNGGDLISIRNTSRNIWIDHCELYSEDPEIQTNKDLYDGLIDIKNETGFITISWCYFHDHHKVHLVGSSDSDLYTDRKITFHHNWYENVNSRLPLYRGAVGHVFNNYMYMALGSCVNSRMSACIRVEKNYFENSKNTIMTSDVGYAEIIDNKEVNCNFTEPYPGSCAASIEYTYYHVLTSSVDDVKDIVLQYAGVGKLDNETFESYTEEIPDKVDVFHNSATNMIHIKYTGTQPIQLEIIDMLGRVMIHKSIFAQDLIDLSSYKKGMYIMIFRSGKERSVHKFIVR
jgi:pectate lyase